MFDLTVKITQATGVVDVDSMIYMSVEQTRTIKRGPDAASVTLYNYDAGAKVGDDITVSIDGQPFVVGTIAKVEQDTSDVDTKTTIKVGDGLKAWQRGTVSRVFTANTTLKQIAQELTAQQDGLSVAYVASSIASKMIPGPVNVVGSYRRVMTEIVSKFGGTWTVQQGQVYVLDGEMKRAGVAYVLTDSTPYVKIPAATGGTGKIKLDLLFEAALVPGVMISDPDGQVGPKGGEYVISKTVHRVDQGGRVAETEVEAKR